MSKYILDAKPYHEENLGVTWEQCTLRVWLNNEFITTAFTGQEQAGILLTDVDNSDSQGYSWNTTGGKNTQDRVFLLSYAEANRYLGVAYKSPNMDSRAVLTAHAKKAGANIGDITVDGSPIGWWWLRSPGYFQRDAANVRSDGSLYIDTHVSIASGGVRPALWINLESGNY